jgi:hypothetical protein
MSGEAIILAASSVVAGRDSSTRGFFVAEISLACSDSDNMRKVDGLHVNIVDDKDTEETPALVALVVAQAVPIGVSTPTNKSRKADGLHVTIVDDESAISFRAGTKEELDYCTGSAIKVKNARYVSNKGQQQQGFEHDEKTRQADRAHELELLLNRLARKEKKEAWAHELEMARLQQELEMARLQQQPSTPRHDLFLADVHPQVMITPGATSRKRLQPMSTKSRKRRKLDVGEDGTPTDPL